MKKLTTLFLIAFLTVLAFYVVFKWQGFRVFNKDLITVVGEYSQLESNNIARFSVSVEDTNADKAQAVEGVTQTMETIIARVKEFGIPEEDLQTQSINIYQREEPYYDNGVQKFRKGDWQVTNSLEITLRDVNRVTELSELLSTVDASSVNGPNFYQDAEGANAQVYYDKALENAREKAVMIAKSEGRSVGAIVNIVEGYSVPTYNFMESRPMGGGGGIVPGTSQDTVTLTVTYELK